MWMINIINIIKKFGMNLIYGMGQYHALFSKIYILLLPDLFEQFRKMCLE